MPRIDDYKEAIRIAAEQLGQETLSVIADRSGYESIKAAGLKIPFLNRVYHLSHPACEFADASGSDQEIPLQEQVLILHYLQSQATTRTAAPWVAYREIPGASFYFSAFIKRAIDPLKSVFGADPDGLAEPAAQLQGQAIEAGDAGYHFEPFPHLALQLILWGGDDEFAPEANILFPKGVEALLSPEDIAWAASLLVYRLIALKYQS